MKCILTKKPNINSLIIGEKFDNKPYIKLSEKNQVSRNKIISI